MKHTQINFNINLLGPLKFAIKCASMIIFIMPRLCQLEIWKFSSKFTVNFTIKPYSRDFPKAAFKAINLQVTLHQNQHKHLLSNTGSTT